MKIILQNRSDTRFLALSTIGGILLSFLLVTLMSGYQVYLNSGGNPVDFPLGWGKAPEAKPAWQIIGRNQISVLLIGSDAHLEFDAGRSDTILWGYVDLRQGKVDVISIPRDLLVKVPTRRGGYFDKICHTYGAGGEELVKSTVESFLGVSIDQIIRIDYNGFIRVIDTLGGVEVDVERAMNYDDYAGKLHIHLKPGRQVLSGQKSLEYVRFRSTSRGDLDRIERQQKFLTALKKKSLDISHIGKLNELARIVGESIHFAPEVQFRDILTLMIFFSNLEDGDINYHSVPVRADISYHRLSSLVPDYKALDSLIRQVLSISDDSYELPESGQLTGVKSEENLIFYEPIDEG